MLLCSCTHLNNENTGLEPVTEIEGPAMYGIKLFQQNQLKFSGILAVKKDAEKLDYVLLDASGVNLISAAVDQDKQIKVKQAVAEMKKEALLIIFQLYFTGYSSNSLKNCRVKVLCYIFSV